MAIINVSRASTANSAVSSQSYPGAMAMVTTLFFAWGFLTCLNDILIPHLKNIFSLNYAQVMLVQFVFFSGYAIFAVPAGKIIEKIGYQRAMVAGLLTMAVGALLFLPAASVPAYAFFLTALIVLAAGITTLQVAANPYVSILGPAQTASSRLNLTQAFNSLGTTVAPWFGSFFILSAAAKSKSEIAALSPAALQQYRLTEAATVKMPYVLIAVCLVVLAFIIARFRFPDIASAAAHPEEATIEAASHQTSIWKQTHLVLGVIGIFVYVGAEVAIGSFLVNFFSQPTIGNLSEQEAAKYVSFYWGLAMLGRFIGSVVLQRIRAGILLGFVALFACALVIITILTSGHLAMWTIILVGLFNSVMFPSIFTLGIANLGAMTSRGSGLLVAAIVGGAIVPLAEGQLADSIGIHRAFIIPALCYVFIAYYGFVGSKPRLETRLG